MYCVGLRRRGCRRPASLLPDPLGPVITTNRSRGMSRSTFCRLWTRAPRMRMHSATAGCAWTAIRFSCSQPGTMTHSLNYPAVTRRKAESKAIRPRKMGLAPFALDQVSFRKTAFWAPVPVPFSTPITGLSSGAISEQRQRPDDGRTRAPRATCSFSVAGLEDHRLDRHPAMFTSSSFLATPPRRARHGRGPGSASDNRLHQVITARIFRAEMVRARQNAVAAVARHHAGWASFPTPRCSWRSQSAKLRIVVRWRWRGAASRPRRSSRTLRASAGKQNM